MSATPSELTDFWIDVGGTFTDCIGAGPEARRVTTKLLSTGAYHGRIGPGSNDRTVRWHGAPDFPAGFFDGWTWGTVDRALAGRSVVASKADSGALTLELDQLLDHPVTVGDTFELTCGLEAPVIGIRYLLGIPLSTPIGRVRVRLGTTRGTNALLERAGARMALVATAGLRDMLRIGNQTRPRLFDLHVRKPADLYADAIEIDERVAAAGRVLLALDETQTRTRLADLHAAGIESLAVVLMNSYRNGDHERRVAAIAREVGFVHVSVSSQLSPLQRIIPRGETTVVDAYLAPIIAGYIARLRDQMPEADLQLMTSAGSLVDADAFVAKDSVLSGPAGGVVGAAHVGRRAGHERVIGLDMGGTSTDVCRYDGQYIRRYEMEIEDRATGAATRIMAPMLEIETVAAGGGSICDFDGVKPIVGPRSAGADPGPACYGAGGPLCLTDVNLLLGRIVAERFAIPLSPEASAVRLAELLGRIESATGRQYEPDELAAGYLAIANAHMAAAIRKVSSRRGVDPRDYALVAFGGAGGQHACAIARELGMRTVILNPLAGILSAHGIGMAQVTRFAARDVGRPLSELPRASLAGVFDEMLAEARAAMPAGEFDEAGATRRCLLDLRYEGQDSTLTIEQPDDGDWAAAFERAHRREYGFAFPQRAVEVRSARVELAAGARSESSRADRAAGGESRPEAAAHEAEVFFGGGRQSTRTLAREDLPPGEEFVGPLVITEAIGTIVVEPGWRARLTEGDALILTDTRGCAVGDALESGVSTSKPDESADPITLEIFNSHFSAIAEQMGATLERTALSTNVKERRDFSCAICDAAGRLVAHAPHVPVHLGAIGSCVRRLLEDAQGDPALGPLRPGDVIATNDPYRGGSHLPDVTVITPVFDAAGESILFFAANRAHHTEIGGIAPGSMPPGSRCLADEGVVIRNLRVAAGGASHDDELRVVLSSGPHPSRAVDQNVADIHAQVAANQCGTRLLGEMIAQWGWEHVHAYMGHIQHAAATKLRAALRRMADGRYEFADALDGGARIAVCIEINGERARVDFTGTDPVIEGNLNATPAIVGSAVLYCLRCLIDDEIPLNEGLLAPVEIVLPECLLNPPAHDDPRQCPAVAGGNVETSQRIVDCVLGALGVVAASQGTMNNLTFGDATFGYYETIGGGTGAGPDWDGADAVHSHMTNTRLTDPEVLEERYPVRLRRFEIRRGSGGGGGVGAHRFGVGGAGRVGGADEAGPVGGAGGHTGGDGIIREFEFLRPLEVSLLTQRRTRSPYGLHGGQPGACGVNTLIDPDGTHHVLAWDAQFTAAPGSRLMIETPGGGAFGNARSGPDSA